MAIKVEKLETMKGKEYFYNGIRHRIANYKFDRGIFTIVTNTAFIEVAADDLHKFTPAPPLPSSRLPAGILHHNNTVNDLRQILMDTISRIEISRDYIPQAVAINDSVGKLIDLAKAELQALELYCNLKIQLPLNNSYAPQLEPTNLSAEKNSE